jgi:hypothetical protein
MNVIHQKIDSEILDEEARLVLQALLVEGVQDGMSGTIRRRNGTAAASIRPVLNENFTMGETANHDSQALAEKSHIQ